MPLASIDGGWTPALIQLLRTLWAEGHSTAEIGRRMGLSKNAVVGKAHRLNLPARPSPIRAARAVEAPRPRAPRRPPCPPLPPLNGLTNRSATFPTAVKHAVPARPVHRPRLDLRTIGTSPCCWPLGEPGRADFRLCGDPAITNKPYCSEHASIAYVKKPRQRPTSEGGRSRLSTRLPGRLCVDLEQ